MEHSQESCLTTEHRGEVLIEPADISCTDCGVLLPVSQCLFCHAFILSCDADWYINDEVPLCADCGVSDGRYDASDAKETIVDQRCIVCGAECIPRDCAACNGFGGWHDCGEDTCNCLEPGIDEVCRTCGGTGEYLVCDLCADRKPCPFCGGKDVICYDANALSGERTQEWAGECRDCGARGPWEFSRDAALAHWNQRKEPQ